MCFVTFIFHSSFATNLIILYIYNIYCPHITFCIKALPLNVLIQTLLIILLFGGVTVHKGYPGNQGPLLLLFALLGAYIYMGFLYL